MCGIFGQWNINNKPLNTEIFNVQRDTLTHRGPDSANSWISENLSIGIAQTRLAIIDLDVRANQPLHNETNNVHIVANGEIYNYKELRIILEKAGHRFKSNSDSEVIVHGWEEWNTELPSRLEGMFAFAIYDEKKKVFFAARDRFGIKPFYYHLSNIHFTFSSELKAIVSNSEFQKKIDWSSACDYFTYRYIPSPKTIWDKVSKLPPAHSILIDNHGKSTINEYWRLNFNNITLTFNDAVNQAHELLLKSVKKHLLSDVAVGTFLSGGYDSSALVLFQDELKYKQKTFTIGFSNWNKSEHQYADIIAKQFKTEHYNEVIGENSLELLGSLAWNYDEPNGDISTIPTFKVSRLASKYVKVVLSGEGADEIFGGYTWHHNLMNRNNFLKKEYIYNYLHGNKLHGIEGYSNAMAMGLFSGKKLKELFTPEFHSHIPENPFWFYNQHFRKDLSPLKAFQYLDIKTFMAELVLQKVDRASMANSLEARVPFLDRELVEFMFNLDEKTYFQKGKQKAILQEILRPKVPSEIINRKKQGFTGPDKYYQNSNWYKNELKNSLLVRNGILNKHFIESSLNSGDYWRLWKIVVFEKWYKKWN